MSIKKVFAAALACVTIGSSLAWGQTWTTSTIQNVNGIDYELWNQNNTGTVNMDITGGSDDPNGGTFEATWSGTENILFRAGKKWGSSSNTTARSLGNITLDFAATWQSPDDVKMLGVYGWAYYPSESVPTQTESGQHETFSDQIEYYIIQDRGSYNPGQGATNSNKRGEATIDGIVYEFWVGDRLNQPMLTGNGNFKQYFSIPKNTSNHRTSGEINISRHFAEWEKVGMQMMDCPLYEIAMKVESYTGPGANSSGSANVTRNLLILGGSGSGDDFYLVTNVSPSGAGTVTRDPDEHYYAPDETVQLTATPNSGWRFIGWEGDASDSTSSTTVTMSEDRTVTARFELESGEGTTNLIEDGDFPGSSVIDTDEGASWRLGQGEHWGDSEATSSVSNGTATINVTTIGEESYQPQLVQYGLALDEDVMYKLTFTASAESERTIEVSFQQSVDPWAGYASEEFDLTTSEEEYEFVFTMNDPTDLASQFAFNLGQETGIVHISDIKLVHTTDGSTSLSRGNSVRTTRGSTPLVSITGRTLNVSPVDGSNLQVRVVDVKGQIRANFNAAGAETFSLTNIPAGMYFVDVKGTDVKQLTPIVLR
ncbi:glycoside hydrolase family 11 protein [Chitinispirillales bacterium ANBcel5]|uniref:glycoside hydrolase family 11 protein n=1 Tax=Cellulosispirillum alkaliphilum TaxID=3039283 RepID=UPI002A5214EF|nr:glycoside hydrolase family 11 protein [Chitinispirillales bacterium ANBcel5]